MKLLCNILRFSTVAALTAGLACAGDVPQIASPYRHYSLKLNSIASPTAPIIGQFLKVSIDGGPPLRMLLDSGTQRVILGKHAAAGRTAGASMEVIGIGTQGNARQLAPAMLQIGDLILKDCETMAVDSRLSEGIDGVIPLSLFAGFLVHLDIPGRMLELDPYPQDSSARDSTYSFARADNHLLFVDATINDAHSGYVLLDTGATYNVICPAVARHWSNSRLMQAPVSLLAGTSPVTGFLLPPGIRFRLGTHEVRADPAVVVDLSDMGRHHQMEVAGVLGYPALSRSVLTVNYRDGLVRIGGK